MTRKMDSGTLMMEWMLKIRSQGEVCSLQAIFKFVSPILPLYLYKNNIGASSANGNRELLLGLIVSCKVIVSSFDFGQFDLDFLQRW